jgi:hypothetical protein
MGLREATAAAAGLRKAAAAAGLHEVAAGLRERVGGAHRRGVAAGRLVTEGSSGALRAGVFEVLQAGTTTRVQAAACGFLARKAVRALRMVERVAEDVAGRVAHEV